MATAKTIVAIDKKSVHRICSGQVILDLSTAVKELVENSLDAGATSIEIKFKEYGLESVDVIDNGSGIIPSNYEALTLKYHTSKLSTFEDLSSVASFGFRGEALSSLCALAKLTMTTCTRDQTPEGVRLEFDPNGRLVSKGNVAREPGTTVSIQELFYSLPVRHREFKKNIKKEYGKALGLLQAYAIICEDVRIICTNQSGKGTSAKVLATSKNKTVRDNIVNIFGAKIIAQLMPLDITLDLTEDNLSEGDDKKEEKKKTMKKIHIVGFISKPQLGNGRSSSDRQYLFINGRPVSHPKMARTFNDVYRGYNSYQYPFIVADFRMPRAAYDVNVSPDKRTVFIHSERAIFEDLNVKLNKLFEPSLSAFTIGTITAMYPSKRNGDVEKDDLKTENGSPFNGDVSPISMQMAEFSNRIEAVIVENSLPSENFIENINIVTKTLHEQKDYDGQKELSRTIEQKEDIRMEIPEGVINLEQKKQERQKEKREEREEEEQEKAAMGSNMPEISTASGLGDDGFSSFTFGQKSKLLMMPAAVLQPEVRKLQKSVTLQKVLVGSRAKLKVSETTTEETARDEDMEMNGENDLDEISEKLLAIDRLANIETFDASNFQEDKMTTMTNTIDREIATIENTDFNLNLLMKYRLASLRGISLQHSFEDPKPNISPAGLSVVDNVEAEQELSRIIHKSDFEAMKIIGQFNLGFIIAKMERNSGEGDLFIIDQHASDEKYNFETLQKNTKIENQRLIQPRPLELTAGEELVAIENRQILEANGFEIIVNEDAPATQKIKLVSQPVSKSTIFDTKDLEELLFLLSERPGEMVHASKVRAMFASRACRKSVMIGKSLDKSLMKKIVRHMGEIDQPWNCPHGRPTMRHLFDLSTLSVEYPSARKRENLGSLWKLCKISTSNDI